MPAARTGLRVGVLLSWLSVASMLWLIAGCGGASAPSSTQSPRPSGGAPTSPVAGVIIGVESTGLNGVHAFTLRTGTGAVLRFTLGNLDNPTQFPPGHLAEHQLTGIPVLAFFMVEGTNLIVYHLEDAPVASPS